MNCISLTLRLSGESQTEVESGDSFLWQKLGDTKNIASVDDISQLEPKIETTQKPEVLPLAPQEHSTNK